MSSLKEVKNRIATVSTTRKITQARQMVSSAQLRRAQDLLDKARVYRDGLESVLEFIPGAGKQGKLPYNKENKTARRAIIIFSSNSGMCSSFNSRMIKEASEILKLDESKDVLFFPIGRKIREALSSGNFCSPDNKDYLTGSKVSFEDISVMVDNLIEEFVQGRFKSVEMVFYHFKSAATQVIRTQRLLPFHSPTAGLVDHDSHDDRFIIEPSVEKVLMSLIPMIIKARFYSNLMDNIASEHAARAIAMQIATENADNILDELQLSYNKLRQQGITSELLDIVGSSFA